MPLSNRVRRATPFSKAYIFQTSIDRYSVCCNDARRIGTSSSCGFSTFARNVSSRSTLFYLQRFE
jgi:hypothetical protein